MIESNILGAAVGIQNQGVIDKTEGTSLPAASNAVIAGKFKRGRMDKAFTVTRDNYKALLGHEPSNPSYQAVEDCFNRGVSQVGIRRVGTPGKSQPSDGGSNTLEMNFLKLRAEIIEETQGVTAGIVYKINDGLINTAILSAGINPRHTSLSVFGAGSNSLLNRHFLGYEPDLLSGVHSFLPPSLDQSASYSFGMNNALFAEFTEDSGFTGFDGIDEETVLTLYPASTLPPANIDYDVFDLIIDPASYTQADLQYFADRGVTPATKNPDGSYTLKSQLTSPPPPPLPL